MGRAEQRRAERARVVANGKGRVSLSHKEIGQIKEAAETKILEYNVEALMTCFALVLEEMDEPVMGAGDIQMALGRIDELMGAVLDGTASIEDYKNELELKTGLVVSCK